jgi:hypothetical protein
MTIFFSVLAGLGYVVAPVSLIWGWARWLNHPKLWTIAGVLALIGFVLASVSGMLGIATILFASTSGTSIESQVFRRLFLTGLFSSVVGVPFAVGGIWRKSQLRWFAPVGALSTLAFWLLVTTFID